MDICIYRLSVLMNGYKCIWASTYAFIDIFVTKHLYMNACYSTGTGFRKHKVHQEGNNGSLNARQNIVLCACGSYRPARPSTSLLI